MNNRNRRLKTEIESHLQMAIRDRMERGESRAEAEANARRELGNVGLIQEVTRDQWSWAWLEQLVSDVRYGLRAMRRNPGFTAVAVLSLALGLGANTAIFSVMDGLMLRMLPVRDPARLALVQGSVYSEFFHTTLPFDSFPIAVYDLFRTHNHAFTDIMAYGDLDRPEIKINGQSEGFGEVQVVSGNFFRGLGVDASLGRLIDGDGADPVVVISYGYWKRRFALDPSVIGRKIAVNNVALQIVGVTPPRFFGASPDVSTDIWAPLSVPGIVAPADDLLSFIARLKPGVTLRQAETDLSVLYAQAPVEIQYVKGNSKTAVMHVLPGAQGYSNLREQFSRPLQILMIVAALVLLTACANVASLLLARANARQMEIRTRLAIGAGRARLVRQLLTESFVLAAAGGVVGLALAMWGNPVLLGLLPESPAPLVLHLDMRILGFNAVATLLTVLLFGLAPALRATRQEVRPVRSARSGLRLHKTLVATQVALSLFLLTAAGLFVGSLGKLKTTSLGFTTEKLVQVSLDTRGAGYRPGAQVVTLYQQLIERFSTIPGVRAVSGVRNGLIRNGSTSTNISVPGYRSTEGPLDSADVAPRFFETAGLSLLSGRDIAVTDTADAPKVVVINESLARQYFPGKDPVGLPLTAGSANATYKIIGVVRDARIVTLRRHVGPTMFFAALQGRTDRIGSIEIRTTGDPASVMAEVRREVLAINPRLLLSVKTMDQQVDDTLSQERMVGKLSGFFGAVTLLLASIGLYGLMAYAVTRRIREIGIRMAVGAERHNVLWMILRETLELVAIGLAIGVPATYAGARVAAHWIDGLLYNTTATDPAIIALAAALLLTVAVVAGYLPARRASRLDPMIALRYE